jgi:putative AlgH/UPF0301 family transcriptional regulator
MNLKGHLLVPTPRNADTGLWFIFHHEPDGVLAVDVTTPHPDLPFQYFEQLADHDPTDKTALLGGPEQSGTAMLVLHNDPHSTPDPHKISDDFWFFSRRFVLVPGKPPVFTNSREEPSKFMLGAGSDYIVTMGFRLWNMEALEEELKNWQWHFLPASPDILFGTKPQDRLSKARRSIN